MGVCANHLVTPCALATDPPSGHILAHCAVPVGAASVHFGAGSVQSNCAFPTGVVAVHSRPASVHTGQAMAIFWHKINLAGCPLSAGVEPADPDSNGFPTNLALSIHYF